MWARGGRFSWLRCMFSDFVNQRFVWELIFLSSHFCLAIILTIFALKNLHLKVTPQLNMVVCVASIQIWFSCQMKKPKTLSHESKESQRSVTLQGTTSKNSGDYKSLRLFMLRDASLVLVCSASRSWKKSAPFTTSIKYDILFACRLSSSKKLQGIFFYRYHE